MLEGKVTNIIFRNYCLGFCGLLVIAMCDATLSFGLASGMKSVKGYQTDLICDLGGAFEWVDLYKTDTLSTKDATAFTRCNADRCLGFPDYNFKQNATSVTITILELKRVRDEKWWSCKDSNGTEAQFKLTVFTEPEGVLFSSTYPCDLAKESCRFTCRTSSCASPAPTFHLYFKDATEENTQSMFGNFIQATESNNANCSDEEYKYSVPIIIPRNTTFTGNIAKTITLECRIRFETLANELRSNPSDPVQFAVEVKHVHIVPEQGEFFDVVENQSEAISCITAGSRPASTVTWFSEKTGQETRPLGAGTERLATVDKDLTVTNSTLMFQTTRNDQGWRLSCEAASFGYKRVLASNPKQLNVLYPTSVTVFSASKSGKSLVTGTLTVDEHEGITGKCKVDSNPASYIEVLQRDTFIVRADDSNEISFQILNATCFNNGVLECKGWNNVPGSTIATKRLQLNVKCSPRQEHDTDPIVLARQGMSAVMSLSVLAYPAPTSYTWHRLVNGKWILVRNSPDFLLTSSSLQYNLTVTNVTWYSYGSYNLTLENGIGSTLKFTFSLQNKGKPEEPTDISVTVVSPTAITVAWTAGYDGEVQQQFYIQYKFSNANDWNTVEVEDRKSDARLSVDINDLQSSTDYMLRMFSANAEGNSPMSEILTFRMKDPESSSLGAIIGGVVGGIVAGCMITSGIFCICRKKILSKDNTADTTDNLDDIRSSVKVYDDLNADREAKHMYAVLQGGTAPPNQRHVEKQTIEMKMYDNLSDMNRSGENEGNIRDASTSNPKTVIYSNLK